VSEQQHDHHTKRDAETLFVLGLFVTVLAVPVLIGTIWAQTGIQTVVNLVAGIILLGIGVGMVLRGRSVGKSL
jgi:hypothetical protein